MNLLNLVLSNEHYFEWTIWYIRIRYIGMCSPKDPQSIFSIYIKYIVMIDEVYQTMCFVDKPQSNVIVFILFWVHIEFNSTTNGCFDWFPNSIEHFTFTHQWSNTELISWASFLPELGENKIFIWVKCFQILFGT